MKRKTQRKYYVFWENAFQRSFRYIKKAKVYALSLEGLVEIDVKVTKTTPTYISSNYYPKVYTVVEDTKYSKKHH